MIARPKILLKKLSELNAAPYNPRKISDAALAGLEASMEKFGVVQPIIWNARTGNVVGGHQRLKILKKRKIKDAEVVVVDIDESDEKALNVALNNQHISGEFTDDLQGLLSEIERDRADLFDSLQLDKLRADIPEVKAPADETYKSKFEVVVEVSNEDEQRELYERLSEEGYSVKILSI
jgi:ParB-like chromosome segregation protein Spo0J